MHDPATGQFVYQLTAEGESALKDGEADRKRLFPKQSVRPAKQPLRTGQLPGDVGQNVARKVSGGKGKQDFGRTIEAAMTNLAQVPNELRSVPHHLGVGQSSVVAWLDVRSA